MEKLLALLILIAAACASVMGREFSQAEYDGVVLGKTTETELRSHFGEPSNSSDQAMTQVDFDNRKFPHCGKVGEPLKWLGYTYSYQSATGYKIESRNFVINGKGIVCNKNTNLMQNHS